MDLCDTPSPGRASVAELSVLGWPIEGLENISINTDYIELSVVFVCSGDVSSKHALSALHPLCPMAGVYSRDQISNKKPRPARHCDCLSAVAGAGQTQTGSPIHQGLTFNISSGDWVWRCLCPNIAPDIHCVYWCWRSVLCWVTINNILLQSKLIFT